MMHIKLKAITNAAFGSKYFVRRPPPPPPPDPGVCSKGQNSTFRNMVMHIKLNGITKTATWWQIVCLQTIAPPTLRVKFQLFSEHGHVAYHILKGESRMQQHGIKYFARRPPSDPRGGVIRSKFNFFRT